MADAQIVAPANANQVKDTQGSQVNQQIGKLVEASATSNEGLITALTALAAAINAKPSA